MKKVFRVFMSMSLLLILCCAFSVQASAVTKWSKGGTEVVRVWTNKTGSSPSITLKLDKGSYTYTTYWTGKQKNGKGYGYYNITVKPVSTVDGGKTRYSQSHTNIDSSSKKITLEKGTYYEIVISWNDSLALNPAFKSDIKWTSYPTWSVKSTKNCGNFK